MKSKFYLVVLVLIPLLISCNKESSETKNLDTTVSEAVKIYFSFDRATSGLNNSSEDEKKTGYAFSHLNDDPANEWADFYNNPIENVFYADSCGYSFSVSMDDYGNTIDYYDFGSGETVCPYSDFSKKGNASILSYNAENIQSPIVSSYVRIANCEFNYPSTGKCYSLVGSISESMCKLLDSVWVDSIPGTDTIPGWRYSDSVWYIRNVSMKIGECGNEIEYVENQETYFDYSTWSSVVYKGSSQHKGNRATYNSVVLESLYLSSDKILKGIVKVTYIKDGYSGEFTIDYGDGTNDYIATITENGNTYTVDYVELQNEMCNSLNE
jgi:hypothetical protein